MSITEHVNPQMQTLPADGKTKSVEVGISVAKGEDRIIIMFDEKMHWASLRLDDARALADKIVEYAGGYKQ